MLDALGAWEALEGMFEVPMERTNSLKIYVVIGHGIGGINFPDNMAQLAKMQDRWSK